MAGIKNLLRVFDLNDLCFWGGLALLWWGPMEFETARRIACSVVLVGVGFYGSLPKAKAE